MLQTKAVFLIASLLCLLSFLVLYSLRQNRIGGINQILLATLLGAAGNALYGFGRELPPLLSYEFANGVYASASAILFVGYRQMFGRRPISPVVAGCVALLIALVALFHYVFDSFLLRSVVVSLFQIAIAAAIAATVLGARSHWPQRRYGKIFILSMCALVATGHLARIVWQLLATDGPTSLLQPNEWTIAFLTASSVALPALAFGAMLVAHSRIVSTAEEASNYDFLTGALSRRAFFRMGERELAYAKRTGRTFAIVLIDFDNFKPINDSLGHAAGDRVLVSFAKRAQHALRAMDSLGRLGGDEFAVLIPDTDLSNARSVASRIKAQVESEEVGAPSVTLSIGIALARPEDTLGSLLDRADNALYEAKNLGRNRIVAYGRTLDSLGADRDEGKVAL